MKIKYVDISELLGTTLLKIENKDNYELIFNTTNGSIYKMYHEQDCCEHVTIEDIIGDLDDLVGTPILMAEEVTNKGDIENNNGGGSYTWTFYKLATSKGYVTIRWYGESTGFYSESVRFAYLGENKL